MARVSVYRQIYRGLQGCNLNFGYIDSIFIRSEKNFGSSQMYPKNRIQADFYGRADGTKNNVIKLRF